MFLFVLVTTKLICFLKQLSWDNNDMLSQLTLFETRLLVSDYI